MLPMSRRLLSRTVESLRPFPYMNADRSAHHDSVDAGGRIRTPGSGMKRFVTHGPAIGMSPHCAPEAHGAMQTCLVAGVHTVGLCQS